MEAANNKDTYSLIGKGALAGAGVSAGAVNAHLSKKASQTVSALGESASACDSFVKSNEKLISKAVESKKGFFGKVNSKTKFLTEAGETKVSNAVNRNTKEVVDGYFSKAAKKLSETFSGDKLTTEAQKLGKKYLKNDIFKSYKDAAKGKSAVIIAASSVVAALGALAVKGIASKVKESKAESNAQKSVH